MRALHIILLTVGVSVPWLLFLKYTAYEYSNYLESLNTRLSQVQLKLDEKNRVNKQLVKNLALAQKSRLHAEKQQQFLYDKLVTKNKEISDLVTDDWETHYNRTKDHNKSLIQRIDYLENNYQDELNELDNNQQNLLDLNESLTNDLIRLEFEYDNLNMDMQSIINSHKEIQKQERIKYEDIISKQREEIELLSHNNNKLNEIINKITAESGNKTIRLTQPEIEPDTTEYRKNRISSLTSALVNRNSNERKQILINVIPTIPDGIYAEELLSLTNAMDSSDTSQVVQSVDRYIVRPVSAEFIDELTTNLNKADAELIIKILGKK